MNLKALIVDDEYPARRELRYLLSQLGNVEVVGEVANATEALRLIRALDYAIVFLDIQMPGMSGLELAQALEEAPARPYIVFVTAYDEYAVKAFEVNAVDYLLKPFDEQRLQRAVDKVCRLLGKNREQEGGRTVPFIPEDWDWRQGCNKPPCPGDSPPCFIAPRADLKTVSPMETPPAAGKTAWCCNAQTGKSAPAPTRTESSRLPGTVQGSPREPARLDRIPVEKDGKTLLIPQEEVVFAYTQDKNVLIKTGNIAFPTRFTLGELQERLDSDVFFRTHRCYIVNLKMVKEILPFFKGTYTLVVNDDKKSEVPVSRNRAKKLRKILGI